MARTRSALLCSFMSNPLSCLQPHRGSWIYTSASTNLSIGPDTSGFHRPVEVAGRVTGVVGEIDCIRSAEFIPARGHGHRFANHGRTGEISVVIERPGRVRQLVRVLADGLPDAQTNVARGRGRCIVQDLGSVAFPGVKAHIDHLPAGNEGDLPQASNAR